MSQDSPIETAANPEALSDARALMKSGDTEGAYRILAECVSQGQATGTARLLLSTVLSRLGRKEEALAAARTAAEAHPRNPRAQAVLGRLLLEQNKAAEAVEQLAQAAERNSDDASIAALQAEALLLTGAARDALKAINRALSLAPDNRDYQILRIVVLAVAGRTGKARKALTEFTADDLVAAYRGLLVQTAKGSEAAVAIAASAGDLIPDSDLLALWHAEQLVGAKRGDEAGVVLDKIAPDTLQDEMRIRFFRATAQRARLKGDSAGVRAAVEALLKIRPDDRAALRYLEDLEIFVIRDQANSGDRDAAIAALEKKLEKRPDDAAALRLLYVLRQKAGQHDDVKSISERLTGLSAQNLPSDLASGMATLEASKPTFPIPPEKLEWAWELADKRKWEHDAWLGRLHWGRAADKLLRDWWFNAPERCGEMDALIDFPAPGILELVPREQKCLAVGTHMGPLAAAVHYLQTCGRPFRGFGVAGPDPIVGDAPPMRITASGDASLRQLIEEINKGTIIGFAGEMPSRDGLSVEFLGRNVTLSTMVPRLIWKQKTASVWWHALWQDGRIKIVLERFPDPEENESLDAWCERWTALYLKKVEEVLRGAPENLNLGPGIWNAAKSKVVAKPAKARKTRAKKIS